MKMNWVLSILGDPGVDSGGQANVQLSAPGSPRMRAVEIAEISFTGMEIKLRFQGF